MPDHSGQALVLRALSALGDSRLLLPVALFVGIAWCRERPRMAFEWWGGLALAGVLVAASKLAYLTRGFALERIGFYVVSGHAAMAAAVLPIVFHAAGWQRTKTQRLLMACGGWALAMVIAWSRVRLDLHSLSEVLSGGSIGTAVSVAMIVRWHDRMRTRVAALCVAWIAAGLLYWLVFPQVDLQRWLESLAQWAARRT